MRNWKTLLAAACVGLLSAIGAGVQPALAQSDELTIVLNRNTSNLVGFIAADQDLFKKHGVNVKIVVGSTGAESNEMLAAGRADGATLGLGPSAIAWANGVNLVPIVKYRDGAEVYSIIARKGSGIEKIADLKGKRVAVTKGTDPETGFILALQAHGVKYNEVKVLDARWADHAALLDRGDVDAANANEPFGSRMAKTMSDKVVLIERLGKYYGNGGFLLVTEKVAQSNPKAVKSLTLAYWEGHKIIRDEPAKAIASLRKWLNLDEETAKDTLALFGARPLLTEQTTKDLETNVQLLVDGNRIRTRPDVKGWMAKGFALQNELLANAEYKALAGVK